MSFFCACRIIRWAAPLKAKSRQDREEKRENDETLLVDNVTRRERRRSFFL
jgi:hypothetical protein